MKYLYGDSTSSALEVNYIELLGDALDFCVDVLLATQRVRKWRESAREREGAANLDTQRLEELAQSLVGVLEGPGGGAVGQATARCANQIAASGRSAVSAEIGRVKSALKSDLERIKAEIVLESANARRALETLLLCQDIPGAKGTLSVVIDEGAGYQAQLLAASELKLETLMELEIPSDHLFAQPVRVDKLMSDLEVRAPEMRGWLHKKIKLVPHRLTKKYVAELRHSEQESVIKLRAALNLDEAGFDVTFRSDDAAVQFVPVQKDGGEPLPPFEVEADDADKLYELRAVLAEAAAELLAKRVSLVSARLDGKPLDQHEDPGVMVDRLIELMTPVVQEISRHSLTPDEFVLKRVIDGHHREEIFVPKAELRSKLDRLPVEVRPLFAPLGLAEAVSGGVRREDSVVPIDDEWLEEASDAGTAVADSPTTRHETADPS